MYFGVRNFCVHVLDFVKTYKFLVYDVTVHVILFVLFAPVHIVSRGIARTVVMCRHLNETVGVTVFIGSIIHVILHNNVKASSRFSDLTDKDTENI